MTRFLRRVCLLFATCLAVATASSQASSSRALGDFWSSMQTRPSGETSRSDVEQWLLLDEPGLVQHLSLLPAADTDGSLPLALPLPNGDRAYFEVKRSLVMERALSARYPQIQTFQGVAVDGSANRVRLELGPQGFGAMLFSADGISIIERRSDADEYVSFSREASQQSQRRQCGVQDRGLDQAALAAYNGGEQAASPSAIGPSLRTYRTAIAATGEYTAAFGGTVVGGLAAVVSATNRINQIYEVDLGLRLVLVANNDLVIFTNSGSDPYTNNSGSAMLGQNTTTLNNIIGSANFDFGHVFSTGGGGVASAGICGSGKARGVTGQPTPRNDPFWIDFVAHEMGHQLNGPHTFNGSTGSCSGGNRSPGSAFEVGSGSTIMAYAGICGSENLQGNSDAFFHVDSLARIHTYTQTGSASNCGTVTATGNQTPIVTATPNATIPARTPFALTANAIDPDGDRLTYVWDQFDLGATATNTTTVLLDTGSGQLFRSFDATDSPTRIFPRLSNILSQTQTIGETLPITNRTLRFRVTVRDNQPGGGGVQWSGTSSPAVPQTTLTVVDTGLPFRVTTAAAPVSWNAAEPQMIEWQVAGTDVAPISCPAVNIDFSLDNALTFPISLLSNTPNDGSESISVPSQATTNGRARVSCANNIFFAISEAKISVVGGNHPPLVSLSSGAVTFTTNGPAILIDSAAIASDSDGIDLNGGTLEVALINNGEFNDRLGIRVEGDAAGQVNVVGSSVRFGGTAVGALSGGIGIDPLRVAFNASSSAAAAQAVLRRVTYGNTRDIAGTLPRTVQARLSDGDGGASPTATRQISIALNPDPFLYTFTADVTGTTVTESFPVVYTLTFSKPIDFTSVSNLDFNNAGTSTLTITKLTQPQTNQIEIQVNPTSQGGTLRLRLPASAVILDTTGLPIPVPVEHDVTYTVIAPDIAPPQLTSITNDTTGNQIAARLPVIYLFSFDERISISGLDGSDFSNAGSSAITVADIGLQSPSVLRLRVTPLNAGTLQLRLSGAGVADVSGNALSVPQTDTATITVLPAAELIFSNSFE